MTFSQNYWNAYLSNITSCITGVQSETWNKNRLLYWGEFISANKLNLSLVIQRITFDSLIKKYQSLKIPSRHQYLALLTVGPAVTPHILIFITTKFLIINTIIINFLIIIIFTTSILINIIITTNILVIITTNIFINSNLCSILVSTCGSLRRVFKRSCEYSGEYIVHSSILQWHCWPVRSATQSRTYCVCISVLGSSLAALCMAANRDRTEQQDQAPTAKTQYISSVRVKLLMQRFKTITVIW